MPRIGQKLSPEALQKMKDGRTAYYAAEKIRREAGNIFLPETEEQKNLRKSKGGRPPASANPALARTNIIKEINKSKNEILKAQIESAKGLYYTAADGKHVFTVKPDGQRGEYLLNQLIGKPTESLEIKQITKIQVDI